MLFLNQNSLYSNNDLINESLIQAYGMKSILYLQLANIKFESISDSTWDLENFVTLSFRKNILIPIPGFIADINDLINLDICYNHLII